MLSPKERERKEPPKTVEESTTLERVIPNFNKFLCCLAEFRETLTLVSWRSSIVLNCLAWR